MEAFQGVMSHFALGTHRRCRKRSHMSSLYQAKMKQRGVAAVPETKAGRELDKELADMRKRKATLEDRPRSCVRSVQVCNLSQ